MFDAGFAAAAKGDFAGAWKAIADRFKGTGESAVQLATSVGLLNKTFVDVDDHGRPGSRHHGCVGEAYERLGAGPVFNTNKAIEQFIEQTKKAIAAQQAELQTFGMAAGARERLKLLLEAEAIAKANNTKITPSTQQIDRPGFSVEALNQKMAGQKLIAEIQPIWTQYQLALTNARLRSKS